jgi:hypothetical protein
MPVWAWLIIGLLAVGVIPALWLLDRLGLWLEDRGWLYYRKKKPSSSPMSAWVAAQQFIESGVKHVVQVSQERRNEGNQGADRDRLLANILAALDATPVNPEEIRLYLVIAKREGLDWKELFEEAVRVQRSARPDRVDLIPRLEDVAPRD